MTDVLYVTLVVAFFVLCVAYVRGCDRIIGGQEQRLDPAHEPDRTSAAGRR